MILSEEKRILIEAYKDGLRSILLKEVAVSPQKKKLQMDILDYIKFFILENELKPDEEHIDQFIANSQVGAYAHAISKLCTPDYKECENLFQTLNERAPKYDLTKETNITAVAVAVGKAYQEFVGPKLMAAFTGKGKKAGYTSSSTAATKAISNIDGKVAEVVKIWLQQYNNIKRNKELYQKEQEVRARRYKVNQKYSYRTFKDDWQAIKAIVKEYWQAKKSNSDSEDNDEWPILKRIVDKTIEVIEKYDTYRGETPKPNEGYTVDSSHPVKNKNGFIMLKPRDPFYPAFLEMYVRSVLDPDDAFLYARGLTARARDIDPDDTEAILTIGAGFRQIKDRMGNTVAGEPKFYQDLDNLDIVLAGIYPEVYEMITHDTQRMNWRRIFARIYKYYAKYIANANKKYDYSNSKQREAEARANS